MRRRQFEIGLFSSPLLVVRSHRNSALARVPPTPPSALAGFLPLDPAIPLPTLRLQDPDGGETDTSALLGKAFVANLWATWCAPCVHELPSLQRMARVLGNRVQVVLLNQDRGGAAVAQPFLRRLNVTGVSSYSEPQGRLSRALSVRGLPTTFIGAADGRLLGRFEGAAAWDNETIISYLERLIGAA